jgi:uncharacterized protein YbaR (Trm112 family)
VVVLLAAGRVSGTIAGCGPACRTIFPLAKFNSEKTMISQKLLEIIACPKCKGQVQLSETQDGLICTACQLIYEIRDDIPIMLLDEAKPLIQAA